MKVKFEDNVLDARTCINAQELGRSISVISSVIKKSNMDEVFASLTKAEKE